VTENRDWREAKPKWAIDAATAEIAQWQITAALAWPQEARPEPLPFGWGGYDQPYGTPEPGTYWNNGRYASRVEIREKVKGDVTWKRWLFREGGREEWTTSVVRGPLYATEREACLAALWNSCEAAAKLLAYARAKLLTASDCVE
tara:strand:+ start:23 stop:457 length:435 start_codon:yes stop_codon:yes gene_type:complete